MTQYIYNGTPVKAKHSWVVIDKTRMKLQHALMLDGFETVTPVPLSGLSAPSTEEIQEQFVRSVRAEVTRRIHKAASTPTQINIAAAAAGGVLTEEQMSAYLAGLSWISQMRETGKQLILDADKDFALDEKWPPTPQGLTELLEAF